MTRNQNARAPRHAAELEHLEGGFRRFGTALGKLGEDIRGGLSELRDLLVEKEPEPEGHRAEHEVVVEMISRLAGLRRELQDLKIRSTSALIGLNGNGEDWAVLWERTDTEDDPTWDRWNEITEAFKVEVEKVWQPMVENLDSAIALLNDELVSLRTRLLKLEEVNDE